MNGCEAEEPICLAASISMAMISIGLVFAVIRLLRGPSTPDRVVALDLAALLSVGVIAIYTVMMDEVSFLAGALVVGIITFLGTIAMARYLERTVER